MLTISHTIRNKTGLVTKTLTPRKAIREKCLDCCCWQREEVRKCTAIHCPLWPYRMGKGEPETIDEK